MRLTSPFNLPAPGRRQTLYVVFDLAEPCVFSKQSLDPLYCNSFTHARANLTHVSGAPLLPKLRGKFAEFLNEGSHLRLRIFSSPTCVGLRYGYPKISLEAFLGSVASPTLRSYGPRDRTSGNMIHRICLANPPTCVNPHVQSWAWLASCVPPSVITILR